MATAKDEPTEIELPDNFVQTALPKNLIDELKQGAGRAVFTSSTEKQQSWIRRDGQMSIYTYHFLEALQGAGNQPEDKVVRVSNLMNYLGKAVPESAQRERQVKQTPFYNCATEDFAVALLQGGKGLPSQGWEGVKTEEATQGRGDTINISGNQKFEQHGTKIFNFGHQGKTGDININS